MKYLPAVFVFIGGVFFTISMYSCNEPPPKEKIAYTNDLYLDYRVWGDEESGRATVRLQFRKGGPEADAIMPGKAATLTWDGQSMRPDSSRMNGVYFEKNLSLAEFGKHTVVFINGNEQYETIIEFPVMKMKVEPSKLLKRQDLKIELEGLKARQNLQVLFTDTSFYGRGIDRIFMVNDGLLTIPAIYFARLRNGPVSMEIIREENQVIQHAPPGGGLLSTMYTLKREFDLQ